jgi:hypothetical protein
VHETELAESAALREFGLASPGRTRSTVVAGSVCLAVPEIDSTMVNHVLGLSAGATDQDLDAIASFYGGIRHAVAVHPHEAALDARLQERGYEPGYSWMKFGRGVEPPAEHRGEVQVAEAGPEDAETFGAIVAESYGLPESSADLIGAVVGRPGFHCFFVRDGDRAIGAATLFVTGSSGWCGYAATLPAARGRGAQNALFAARLRCAAELHCQDVYTETGQRVEGRPAGSYRNILRNGFGELYLRPNWVSPG